MNKNKYEFFDNQEFKEIYQIVKFQFKKIINNFNEFKFHDDLMHLFYYKENGYKCFLRKNNKILCGLFGWRLDNCVFCDIFFWIILYQKTNILEYRHFCERNFRIGYQKGVRNVIIPIDKSRFKYKIYKRYCQKAFFTKIEYKFSDKNLSKYYKNHYLLNVNLKDYFEKSQEVKRIKIESLN